ncbi:MAG: dihydropteroate synthase [Pseudobdellovibrio sp.]
MSKQLAVVGVGSNINPLVNLRKALSSLKKIQNCKVLNVAKIYESDALLPEGLSSLEITKWNKKYLNSAILVEVESFNPEAFLCVLKDIEKKIGRSESARWAPRLIDLDLLWVSDYEHMSHNLTIPHKELLNRPFALLPLLDLISEERVFNISVAKAKSLKKPFWMSLDVKPFQTHVSQKFAWPLMVGILNVTTDSFSDGGKFLHQSESEDVDLNALEKQLDHYMEQGLDVLDIGAESTRPNALFVSPATEIARLQKTLSFVEKYKQTQNIQFEVSVDTRKPEVLREIIHKFDINYINDVEGFRSVEMRSLAADSSAKIVCMHSFSVPPRKDETLPGDIDIFEYLNKWWQQKLEMFGKINISKERLIFDVGIGFGKTPEQCFHLLGHLHKLSQIHEDIYIGHSRKSFLSHVTDKPFEERDLETAFVSQNLNQAYVQQLRVHNIKLNKDFLNADQKQIDSLLKLENQNLETFHKIKNLMGSKYES